MRIKVLLMVMMLTAGCSIFQVEVVEDPLTNPLGDSKGPPEVSCLDAIGYVKRALKEQMPGDYSPSEVQFTLESNYDLVGVWRNTTGVCEVYDIPHEELRQRLEGNREIKGFQFFNGNSYVVLEI